MPLAADRRQERGGATPRGRSRARRGDEPLREDRAREVVRRPALGGREYRRDLVAPRGLDGAPTLTEFAAPRGRAAGLGAARRPAGAPTLTEFAAPRGGAAGLGAARRPAGAPTLTEFAAPRGGAAVLGSGPAPGR